VSGLRFRIEWGELSAVEARADELAPHARTLATAYNDRCVAGHTAALDEGRVIGTTMLADGAPVPAVHGDTRGGMRSPQYPRRRAEFASGRRAIRKGGRRARVTITRRVSRLNCADLRVDQPANVVARGCDKLPRLRLDDSSCAPFADEPATS
jgi:hypothetical protein